MNYPIKKVTTKDGLDLHGLLCEVEGSKKILIHTHGTGDSFYGEDFVEYLAKGAIGKEWSFISFNNRGASTLEIYANTGAATEEFEKCVLDLDAWIEFAAAQGYEEIVISGHSLGSEKVAYYANFGTYKEKLAGIILLSFADSYGYDRQELGDTHVLLFAEAEKMIQEGKGDEFLRTVWLSHAGVLPQSAKSYINFFRPDSELLHALPFATGALPDFLKITVPILAIISDGAEYTIIPTKDAVELLKKENPRTEAHLIENTDHDFLGKEKEMAELVAGFIGKLSF